MGSHEAADRVRQLKSAWRAEARTSTERVLDVRRTVPLKGRVARGVALASLSLDDVGPAPGDRLTYWLSAQNAVSWDDFQGTAGDPVRLWWTGPDEADAVVGVLSRRRRDRIAVMADAGALDRLTTPGFRLDLDDPQATFKRAFRALDRLEDGAPRPEWRSLYSLLLAGTPRPDAVEPARHGLVVPLFDAELNAPQQAAVELALSAADAFGIIGPPGTGKTRTLVELLRQMVARGDSVLATAASNAAVDNLAERLMNAGVRVVRIGHPARVGAAVESVTLDALLEASGEAALARQWMAQANDIRKSVSKRSARGGLPRSERRQLLAQARGLFSDARNYLGRIQKALVSSAEVVCATAVGADSQWMREMSFDSVVLDEATQCVDPSALVALTRGNRVVMAGDPNQLPPTVLSREAEKLGLQTTFFERLAETRPERMALLTVQYRMHAAIMAFPNSSKYEGRLEAAPSAEGRRLEALEVAPDPLRPGPLVFVDTSGKGWEDERDEDDPSSFNLGEADRTALEVRRLLSRGLSPSDVAVIAPYGAQVRRRRERLRPEVESGLEVGSIDGFQGREKEAIVLDLVRSNEAGDVGFLRDTRRMNVALTRAKRFLLVVGDSSTLGAHPYYAAFLEAVEADGTYTSAWSDEAEPLESFTEAADP